jgi:hypothetical protein
VHKEKASSPISLKVDGKIASFIFLFPNNATSQIAVTPSGISTTASLVL